jgi:hypothetical protein
MMEEFQSNHAKKDEKPRSKPVGKRTQFLIYLTTWMTIFCLIRYSPVWNYWPRISIQFPSASDRLPTGNHNSDVHYQNPGWIRPCSAPQANVWSALSEDEVDTVLEAIELKKSDFGIKHDAKM